MKVIVLIFGAFITHFTVLHAQEDWQMQAVPISSRWAKDVCPSSALPEYPRPQMVRGNWENLNGLWEYRLSAATSPRADLAAGKILVPYPVESALSGVKRPLLPGQMLTYRRLFNRPKLGRREHLLLHFGAVDNQATVRLNGILIGRHRGGYTDFTFDITQVARAENNDLSVEVIDSTDQGVGPYGKQTLNPKDIFYTATSGIWQTVWLEVVPSDYIAALRVTPDIDKGSVTVRAESNSDHEVQIEALDNGKVISTAMGHANQDIVIPVAETDLKKIHLWTPADPFLYRLRIGLKRGAKVVDEVKSYVGMRKISVGSDENGIDRICLNNKPYFNLGVLDQGFWPDGIYTAPTDEALSFDIKAIKAMGFNTIRKHIKVEPARWYYYTDSLGMLVWQDMVDPNPALPEGAKEAFEQQCTETVEELRNHPSIVAWVLFNEKWGQYDQKRLTDWLHAMDPTRLVNGHTGELLYVNDKLRSPSPGAYVDADMTDVHSYPNPMMPIKQSGKAQVLGEFGGIGVFIAGHQWNAGTAWGYIQEKPATLATKYRIMVEDLELLQKQGLSGSIYTEPFDVEGEENGLMTYDREVIKIPFDRLAKMHARLNPDMGSLPIVTAQNANLTDPASAYSDELQKYLNGRKEHDFLKSLIQLALQAGDKTAASAAGDDYITGLNEQLDETSIRIVTELTHSVADKGFSLMWKDSSAFIKIIGDRPYRLAVMNALYSGIIAPQTENTAEPNWQAIAEQMQPYGSLGEEILLRAEVIDYLNKKDWRHYCPVAIEYLDKYGVDVKPSEKRLIEQAIQR